MQLLLAAEGQDAIDSLAAAIQSGGSGGSSFAVRSALALNILFLFMGTRRTNPFLHATCSSIAPIRGNVTDNETSFSSLFAYSTDACSAASELRFISVVALTGGTSLSDFGSEQARLPTGASASWAAAAAVEFDPAGGKLRYSIQLFRSDSVAAELVSRMDVLLPREPGLPRDFVRTPPAVLRLPLAPPEERLEGGARFLRAPTLAACQAKLIANGALTAARTAAGPLAAPPSIRVFSGMARAAAQLACPDPGHGVAVRRVALPGASADAIASDSVDCVFLGSVRDEDSARIMFSLDSRIPTAATDAVMSEYCASAAIPAGACPSYEHPLPPGAPPCPAIFDTRGGTCKQWADAASAHRHRAAMVDLSARRFCEQWPGHPACDCIRWDDVASSTSPARAGAAAALALRGAPLSCWFEPCKKSPQSVARFLQPAAVPGEVTQTCPQINCQQLIGAFSRTGNATVNIIDSTIGIGTCAAERQARPAPGEDAICTGAGCVPCVDGETCDCKTEPGSGERVCAAKEIDPSQEAPQPQTQPQNQAETQNQAQPQPQTQNQAQPQTMLDQFMQRTNEKTRLFIVIGACAACVVLGAIAGWLAAGGKPQGPRPHARPVVRSHTGAAAAAASSAAGAAAAASAAPSSSSS